MKKLITMLITVAMIATLVIPTFANEQVRVTVKIQNANDIYMGQYSQVCNTFEGAVLMPDIITDYDGGRWEVVYKDNQPAAVNDNGEIYVDSVTVQPVNDRAKQIKQINNSLINFRDALIIKASRM